MQASNFGGTFDQLFLCIFYEIFAGDASLLLIYHGAKKSNDQKFKSRGPALNFYLHLIMNTKVKALTYLGSFILFDKWWG